MNTEAQKPIATESKEFSVHFKKEKIKDSSGNVVGEGKKLPSFKKSAPVPTVEGILAIVENGGAGLALLQEVMADIIFGQIRRETNDIRTKNAENKQPDAEIKAEQIDDSKLDWNYIANLPKSDRRSLGITDEDWESFFTDYLAVMPAATGKDKDRIEQHVGIFKRKFSNVRNDKAALGVLRDALNVWAANTAAMEDNSEVYEYLSKRVESLLAEEEKVLADAL